MKGGYNAITLVDTQTSLRDATGQLSWVRKLHTRENTCLNVSGDPKNRTDTAQSEYSFTLDKTGHHV